MLWDSNFLQLTKTQVLSCRNCDDFNPLFPFKEKGFVISYTRGYIGGGIETSWYRRNMKGAWHGIGPRWICIQSEGLYHHQCETPVWKKKAKLEREEILLIISIKIDQKFSKNLCYNPIGFLAAIRFCMKIVLRRFYRCEKKPAWNEDLPEYVKKEWILVLLKVKDTTIKRCIKPVNEWGNPNLVSAMVDQS